MWPDGYISKGLGDKFWVYGRRQKDPRNYLSCCSCSYLSIYLPIYLSLFVSVNLSIGTLSIYLPIYLSIYPSIYHYLYLSISQSVIYHGRPVGQYRSCSWKCSPNTWQLFGYFEIHYCVEYFLDNIGKKIGYFLLQHLVTLVSSFHFQA